MDCGFDSFDVANLPLDLESLSFPLSWKESGETWDVLIIALSTTTLPGDIILEIMYRLPIKSLARFLSVSKTWYFIVKSKAFCNMHLSRNKRISIMFQHYMHGKQSNPFLPFYHDPEGPLYPVRFTPMIVAEYQVNIMHDKIHVKENIPNKSMKQISTDFCIIGSINGLTLLSWGARMALWNEATNETYPLPLPNILHPVIPTNFTLGFGLNMSDNLDYKVVRIGQRLYGGQSVDIYDYKKNTWNLIRYRQDSMKWCINDPKCAVILKGIPYWRAKHTVNDKPTWRECIVGFDSSVNLFNFIELPSFQFHVCVWDLGAIEDSLVILIPRRDNVLEIFMLEDMKWNKKFSIPMLGVKLRTLVGCLNSGYVVGQSLSGELFICNVWTHDIHYLNLHGCYALKSNTVYEYIESLVPPRFKDFRA